MALWLTPLTMLENMEHRGACGADAKTGDGAGILIQVPHDFLKEVCHDLGIELPDFGTYGVGMVFFPRDPILQQLCRQSLIETIEKQGFDLLGFRTVPSVNHSLGQGSMDTEPLVAQVFVQARSGVVEEALERRLFILRKLASRTISLTVPGIKDHFYFPSLSYKTICYKGQFSTDQLRSYFPDLEDERVASALALVHSRFSTNTFPQWRLAQPFRYLAHNGEINTVRGNINWMTAKEQLMESEYFSRKSFPRYSPYAVCKSLTHGTLMRSWSCWCFQAAPCLMSL